MFSSKLKELRDNKGLSQAELAKRLGVTQQAVGTWERDKNLPDNDVLKKISAMFDVSLDYLLDNHTTSSTSPHSKRDMNDLAKFLNKTEVLFDGDTYRLDEEDRQKLRNALEFVFWDAKRQNKRKKD